MHLFEKIKYNNQPKKAATFKEFFQKNNIYEKSFKNHLTNRQKKCIIIWQSRIRLVGQAAKTSASHAENMGSIPVPVTIEKAPSISDGVFSILWCPVRGI